ncbi:DUF4129 domain-containing protein [Planctomycetota bacterium]
MIRIKVLLLLLLVLASNLSLWAGESLHPRDELRKVLTRDEFQARFEGEGISPEMPELTDQAREWLEHIKKGMEKFAAWVKKMKRWIWGDDRTGKDGGILGTGGGQWAYQVSYAMVWIAGIVICLGLIFMVYRIVTEIRRQAVLPIKHGSLDYAQAATTEDAMDLSADEWGKFAQDCRQQGDLRMALRGVYLGLLVRLHRSRSITYNKNKTNWEYVGEYGQAGPARDVFSRLTRIFDFKWYGMEMVQSSEYERYLADAEALSKESVDGESS